MNLARTNLNFDYPLEDSQADLKGVEDAVAKKTFKSFSIYESKAITPAAQLPATAPIDDEKEEAKEFLTDVLEARKRGEFTELISEDLNTVINFCKNLRFSLTIPEIQAIAQNYFEPLEWKKIISELRQ